MVTGHSQPLPNKCKAIMEGAGESMSPGEFAGSDGFFPLCSYFWTRVLFPTSICFSFYVFLSFSTSLVVRFKLKSFVSPLTSMSNYYENVTSRFLSYESLCTIIYTPSSPGYSVVLSLSLIFVP
ncbi:hypothetical protein PTI98_011286 [Pleurotus ostreatus]|nr:hypothetical protein PTI98_011286 [Pleurotus ostreatus]